MCVTSYETEIHKYFVVISLHILYKDNTKNQWESLWALTLVSKVQNESFFSELETQKVQDLILTDVIHIVCIFSNINLPYENINYGHSPETMDNSCLYCPPTINSALTMRIIKASLLLKNKDMLIRFLIPVLCYYLPWKSSKIT